MSFGLEVINANSELLITEYSVTPMLVAKGIFNSTPVSSGPSINGLYVYRHLMTLDSLPLDGDRIVYFTIPSNAGTVWYDFGTSFFTNSASSFQLAVNVYCASGTSYALPEAYAFSVSAHKTATGTFGLQVYRTDGSLSFDSRLMPMAITKIHTGFAYTTTATSIGLGTLPTKPAFMVPDFSREMFTPHPNPGVNSSTREEFRGLVRRSGTTLYGLFEKTDEGFEDARFSGDYIWGSSSNLTVPMINAANYD